MNFAFPNEKCIADLQQKQQQRYPCRPLCEVISLRIHIIKKFTTDAAAASDSVVD